MKYKIYYLSFALAMLLLASCNNSEKPVSEKIEEHMAMDSAVDANQKTCDLKTAMRKLWEDHITWTRTVICCLTDDLPGFDQSVKRLLKNQDDIGDAVKPYYGNDAGNQLTNLLHNHITIAAEVVKAARYNDKPKLEDANTRWTANADSISELLSKANPNWPLNDMKNMMHKHLELTTDEAAARIKKDYDADVKAYDKVHDEILKMADMLTDGIVKQFPDKFK